MPSFLFQRRNINLDLYYPPFLERLMEAKAKAWERGFAYYSIFGYRGYDQQAQLRTAFLTGKGGKAAPAGYSAHQYGMADDSCNDADSYRSGLQEDWDPKHYDVLGEELNKVGLVWGGDFGDRPHANWPGFVSASQLEVLRNIWRACPPEATEVQRLRAVWQYADSLPIPPRKG